MNSLQNPSQVRFQNMCHFHGCPQHTGPHGFMWTLRALDDKGLRLRLKQLFSVFTKPA